MWGAALYERSGLGSSNQEATRVVLLTVNEIQVRVSCEPIVGPARHGSGRRGNRDFRAMFRVSRDWSKTTGQLGLLCAACPLESAPTSISMVHCAVGVTSRHKRRSAGPRSVCCAVVITRPCPVSNYAARKAAF